MANKQTAVEFLKGELDKFVRCEFGDDPYIRYTLKDLYNAFEQAKQMEKEQIIEAYNNGDNRSAELYYNETFK